MSGKKWRDKSIYQITWRLEKSTELSRALMLVQDITREKVKRLRQEVIEEMMKVADELKGRDPQYLYLSSTRACPEAPAGVCVYDSAENDWVDICVFCDEPDERE